MHRRSLLAATAVAAAFAIAIPATPQGLRQNRFGQVWGTFVHWVDFGPGQAFTGFLTVNVDGTFTVSGSPGPAIHGVWERTGLRNVNFTALLQNFDSTGNLIGLERHRCSFHYSDDFNTYEGKEFAETVTCPTAMTCPNPLEPSTKWTPAPWALPAGMAVSGARVEVVAPGPLK
jgi:hypothetical protein